VSYKKDILIYLGFAGSSLTIKFQYVRKINTEAI